MHFIIAGKQNIATYVIIFLLYISLAATLKQEEKVVNVVPKVKNEVLPQVCLHMLFCHFFNFNYNLAQLSTSWACILIIVSTE